MEAQAIRRLAEVAVRLPTLEETSRFLSETLEFGQITGSGGSTGFFLPGEYGAPHPRRVLTLKPGEGPTLEELVFEVSDATALKELAAALVARGIDVTDVPEDEDGGAGIRLEDPLGISVVCRLDGGAPEGLPPSDVRPRRLGHANIKVPDAAEAAAFYVDVLGLRPTERVGDLLSFLRVNTDHHNLGFRSGADHAGIHHVAFEVKGWEDFRMLCDRLADRGYAVEYGPGRHGPG
ncbi:MAG: VOC family protein, partial [Anaerolineales bacterium]